MDPKTYLVGGAVRDELLGLEPGERDWVITGSTPDALLDQGYRQVGASFPVFLHPQSGCDANWPGDAAIYSVFSLPVFSA